MLKVALIAHCVCQRERERERVDKVQTKAWLFTPDFCLVNWDLVSKLDPRASWCSCSGQLLHPFNLSGDQLTEPFTAAERQMKAAISACEHRCRLNDRVSVYVCVHVCVCEGGMGEIRHIVVQVILHNRMRIMGNQNAARLDASRTSVPLSANQARAAGV